jgi:hypothetical protein
MYKSNWVFRFLLLVAILLAVPTGPASAAMRGCRSDPHFHLSNGDVITVTLEIGTDITDVENIHYILHVPAGVTVEKVTYTAKSAEKTINETYVVYQDSPTGIYITDTVVTTKTPDLVEVTVFSRVNEVKEQAIPGYNGQHLVATLIAKP